MSQREIGPRVGGYSQRPQQSDDLDIQAFIERTPKTNEQTNREKTSTGWEYSFWVIVIIGIVIVLLILVVWFIFKKEEVTEIQRQIQPGVGRPYPQPQHQQKQQPDGNHPQPQHPSVEENQEDKLARETRENLSKKKVCKRDIGMVPGVMPDNPSVLGMKEGEVSKTEPVVPTVKPESPVVKSEPAKPEPEPSVPDNLPDIQSTSVMSRLVSNFGLAAE